MRNGMARDFSWPVSAREYIKMYEKIHGTHAGAPAAGGWPKADKAVLLPDE